MQVVHHDSRYPLKYVIANLQNGVTSEVTLNHDLSLLSLGDWIRPLQSPRVLICSLVEYTLMVHIVL